MLQPSEINVSATPVGNPDFSVTTHDTTVATPVGNQPPAQSVANEKDSYSLAECAKLLKKSKNTVSGYKSLVLKAFAKDPGRVIHPNKSLTAEGFAQLKMAAKLVANGNSEGYLKGVYQANPELEQEIEAPETAEDSTTPRKVADPFAGISARSAIVKTSMTARDTSSLSKAVRTQTELTIKSSEDYNSGLISSLVTGADDLGVQLGEFLSQRIIDSAEATKQSRLDDYIAAQGVTVKKEGGNPEN